MTIEILLEKYIILDVVKLVQQYNSFNIKNVLNIIQNNYKKYSITDFNEYGKQTIPSIKIIIFINSKDYLIVFHCNEYPNAYLQKYNIKISNYTNSHVNNIKRNILEHFNGFSNKCVSLNILGTGKQINIKNIIFSKILHDSYDIHFFWLYKNIRDVITNRTQMHIIFNKTVKLFPIELELKITYVPSHFVIHITN
jgi:hypothetical protein